jgi:hypothetical protein
LKSRETSCGRQSENRAKRDILSILTFPCVSSAFSPPSHFYNYFILWTLLPSSGPLGESAASGVPGNFVHLRNIHNAPWFSARRDFCENNILHIIADSQVCVLSSSEWLPVKAQAFDFHPARVMLGIEAGER